MLHFLLPAANDLTSSFREKTDESGTDGNFILLQQIYNPFYFPVLQLQKLLFLI